MAGFAMAARRVMDDPGAVLEPQCITSACAAAGHRWRTRVLDPVLTVLAMTVQVMHSNAAIAHVVRLMHACFTESAFCQARARLPLKVLTTLLDLMTQGVRARLSSHDASECAGLWRGHRTLLIDGSGISMPDTPALARSFGYPANIHEGCGFPVAHLLAVFDLSSGLLLHALAAPWCVGDASMAARTHGLLKEGDVLVGDRNFGSFAQIAALLARGVHGVFRLNASRGRAMPVMKRASRTRGRVRPQTLLLRRLGPGDELVEWMRTDRPPAWLTREEYRAFPRTLRVRLVRYRVERPGWRTRDVTLVTTLLDPVRYPAEEIARLYGARWSIENNLRCLKRTMGMNVLRCKSVEGVHKEMAVYALVYNLVRLVMLDAAGRQGVEPSRLSFIDALRWLACADADEPPPRLKVNPQREGRWEPRLIKRRPSRAYPFMTLPRPRARDYILKHARWLI